MVPTSQIQAGQPAVSTSATSNPAATARALLVGPSDGPEVTGVESVLRSLIRSHGTDWVLASADCPLAAYPQLVGDEDDVIVALDAGQASRYLAQVDAGDVAEGAVTVIVLNDPHPYFDPGTGASAADALVLDDLHRRGAERRVHLFARSPLRTELLISALLNQHSTPAPGGAVHGLAALESPRTGGQL